jgi:flagellin
MNSLSNYNTNNSALSTNLEKLSSGYRINSAADDAAGLAISEKMRSQIAGLEKAQDNANDGISLVQTAEGALTEVNSMLTRLTELATQSANGTYEDGVDRTNIQEETDAILEEIDRISQSTNFNGINLLDGSLGSQSASFKGTTLKGASVSTFKAASMSTNNIGGLDLSAFAAAGSTAKDTFEIDGEQFEIDWSKGDAKEFLAKYGNDYSSTAMTATQTKSMAADLQDLLNNAAKDAGLNGTVTVAATSTAGIVKVTSDNSTEDSSFGFVGTTSTSVAASAGAAAAATDSVGARLFGTDTTNTGKTADAVQKFNNSIVKNSKFTMTINNTELQCDIGNADIVEGTELKDVATALQTAVQTAVGNYNAATGMNATGTTEALTATDFTVTANQDGSLSVNYGGDVQGVSFSFGEATVNGDTGRVAEKLGLLNQVSKTATSNKGLSLQVGDTNADYQKVTVTIDDMSSAGLGLQNLKMDDQESAGDAIDTIKSAVNAVSLQRGRLGAIQNRLDHTLNNLDATTQNITAAESQIRDVDMAKEMTEYSKNNILSQAAQSMLAQANSMPQGVLQLLQ